VGTLKSSKVLASRPTSAREVDQDITVVTGWFEDDRPSHQRWLTVISPAGKVAGEQRS
jgi:hypothetical protein